MARISRGLQLIGGTVLLLLLGAAPVAAQEAADWPAFRGNAAMSGVARTTLPARPSLRWTYETGSQIEATAAIVGEEVYVATKHGAVHALRLADGSRRWKFVTGGSGFAASPTVLGDRVYLGDEGGTFWAIDRATGQPVWRHRTGDKISASATWVGTALIFGSYDNLLYRLSSGGQQQWSLRTAAQVHAPASAAEGLALVAGCDGKLRMVEAGSGRERRAVDLGGNFAAVPAYAGGSVYLGSMSGERWRVRLSDGRIVWRQREEAPGAAGYASAAASDGAVIFASRSGAVERLTLAEGTVRWTFRARRGFTGSPVLVGEQVVVGGEDGNLYGLRLADGQVAWQFATGAAIYASPAVGRQRLVIGTTDGAVYCFG